MRFLQLFTMISCLVASTACVSEQVEDQTTAPGGGKGDGSLNTHDEAWVAGLKKALDVHKDAPVDAADIKITFLPSVPAEWPTWIRFMHQVLKDLDLGVNHPMKISFAGGTAYLVSGTRSSGCNLFGGCTATSEVYVFDVDQKITASGTYSFTFDDKTTQIEDVDQAIVWDDPPQLPGGHSS